MAKPGLAVFMDTKLNTSYIAPNTPPPHGRSCLDTVCRRQTQTGRQAGPEEAGSPCAPQLSEAGLDNVPDGDASAQVVVHELVHLHLAIVVGVEREKGLLQILLRDASQCSTICTCQQ